MGLSWHHNSGTRCFHFVARYTVSEQNNKIKLANGQSYAVVVSN